MARVVFISSTRGWQSPRDRLGEVFAGILMFLVVYSAATVGWNYGGLLWAILYGALAFVSFPMLLTVGTLICLALLPILRWPGTIVANLLGWTSHGPNMSGRLWLQRISTILMLIPLIHLTQNHGMTLIGLLGGIITFGLILFGLFVVLPVLILTGIVLYILSKNYGTDPGTSPNTTTVRWSKPNPPLLPPPSSD